MMRPNWFDKKFGKTLQNASATEALAEIAKDERIINAVAEALASSDAYAKAKIMGPSRSQLVRSAIAEVLQADS